MTTVDRIFQLIKENGLTAKEFAAKVGLSQGNLTDWKTGRAKPSTDALLKISNAYNVSVDYLLCKHNLKVPLKEYEYFIISNIVNYLFTKYKNKIDDFHLSNDELQILKKYICDFLIKPGDIDTESELFLNFKEPKEIEDLFDFLVYNALKLQLSTYKYIPLASNENEIISNFYVSLDEFKELDSDITLENEDIEFTKKIMTITNRKFIDGPIFEERHISQKDEVLPKPNFYNCPVYGKISAGQPNWAEECLEGYLPVDPNLMGIINPEECFFLRVDGESMNKVIRNGAYALIRKQDIVENGEIAAVLVNGFDATLKKFSRQGDLVILEPASNDSSFTTQVYNKDTQIRVLGKYIGKFEMNK